jgi:hypothetical protein
VSVLDQLPEGQPIKLLRELDAIASEIKAPQTFGSSSVITTRLFSGVAYDISLPAHDTHQVMVEFIPDDLTFGGALCYKLYVMSPGGSGEAIVGERLRVTDDRQRWMLHTNNTANGSALQLKLYFFAGGSGTFTTNLV